MEESAFHLLDNQFPLVEIWSLASTYISHGFHYERNGFFKLEKCFSTRREKTTKSIWEMENKMRKSVSPGQNKLALPEMFSLVVSNLHLESKNPRFDSGC